MSFPGLPCRTQARPGTVGLDTPLGDTRRDRRGHRDVARRYFQVSAGRLRRRTAPSPPGERMPLKDTRRVVESGDRPG